MQKVIFISGTMGSGKTTISRLCNEKLSRSVWLDGDWCWNMNPFVANGENKAMVLDNIAYLLRSFLQNSSCRYVIFCWVIHEEGIFEEIFSRLGGLAYQPLKVTLDVTPQALEQRLLRDVKAGIRTGDVIQRSLARLPLYEGMDTIHLDVSSISAREAAERIAALVQKGEERLG